MNIRKRLIIFGMIWLTICSVALISFIVWQTQAALFTGAAKKSEALAYKLVNALKANIFSGDSEEIEKEINNIVLDDILGASLKFDGLQFDTQIGKTKFKDLNTNIGSTSRLISVNGMRVVKTDITVSLPEQQNVDVSIFLNAEKIYEQTNKILWYAYILLIPMLISFLLIGWILSGKMVSPLHRLSTHIKWKKRINRDQILNNPETGNEIDLIYDYFIELEDTLSKKASALESVHSTYENQLRKTTESFEDKNIQLASALESHNKLLLLLSHEVRTPMTALSLHIANLFESLNQNLTHRQINRIERIKNLASRIFRLMEDVLKFSVQAATRSDAQRECVDLSRAATQVIFSLDYLIKDLDVNCIIDASINNKFVFVNPDHLEQILMNLVHNAIKQSPPGSSIVLSAKDRDGFVQLNVKDSGLGIGADIKDKIFKEPLKAIYPESNGVGLYICRYLVELHKGSIWFKDHPKQGTIFIFTLPKPDSANVLLGQ